MKDQLVTRVSNLLLVVLTVSPIVIMSTMFFRHFLRTREFRRLAKQQQCWRSSLTGFIKKGPLFKYLCKPILSISDTDEWCATATTIAKFVNLQHETIASWSDLERRRIFHLYLPVYLWVQQMVVQIKHSKQNNGPVVIGLSCVQGGGKTTLMNVLQHLLRTKQSLNCVAVSIDDFYLTHADQCTLARKHADNALLQVRGTFGTHDTGLALSTLQALNQTSELDRDPQCTLSPVLVPVYDKSAHHGQGDRADKCRWRAVEGAVDVVLFEGWNLVRIMRKQLIVMPDACHVQNMWAVDRHFALKLMTLLCIAMN